MKIVLLAHRFWPCVGGVENYVGGLARALLGRGHDVTVVAGATQDDLPERDSVRGVKVLRFPARRSPLRCRLWFWRGREVFQSADVVQVSNTHVLEHFRRMTRPWLNWSNVFLTRHGMSGRFPVPQSDIDRARRAQQWVRGVAHDGQFIARWLGVSADICPDPGLEPAADELPRVTPEGKMTATFVGRLEPDTGITTYLDAVHILREVHGCALSLRVVGDGSMRAELEERARRDRLPVEFLGQREDAADQLLRSRFAFVDGRMAILEAFARRRVVLSAYGNEWKKDYLTGERFSPFLAAFPDGATLAAAVVRLADEPEELERRAVAAFEFARGLSWDRCAVCFETMWRERLTEAPVACLAKEEREAGTVAVG